MTFIKKPTRSAIPAVRQLFEAIDKSGIGYRQISERTGVHAVTLTYWRSGKNAPRMQDFSNVAEFVGYKVALVPLDTDPSPNQEGQDDAQVQ